MRRLKNGTFLVLLFISVISPIYRAFRAEMSNYVTIGGHRYSKDYKSLHVNTEDEDFSVSKLNKFTKLEHLTISNIDDDILNELGDFDELKELYIYHSDLSDLSKLDSYPQLRVISFYDSEIDMKDFMSKSVENMFIDDCKITNISALKESASLLSLQFSETAVDDYIVSMNDGESGTKYVLKDSSIFNGWDSLYILDLKEIEISDISGILKMEGLHFINISESMISGEYIEQLKEKGLDVKLV